MTAAARAGATLTIDLDAIAANYRELRDMAAPAAICAAVVKADAYGLGAAPVGLKLEAEGCRHFFVATVDEGLALRHTFEDAAPGEVSEIFVLSGPSKSSAPYFAHGWLTPVLNSMEQVETWRSFSIEMGRPLSAALHVDTGMSRLGVTPADFDQLAAEPILLAGIIPRLVMSHLACADEPDQPLNTNQRTAFQAMAALFPGVERSLANSAGTLLGKEFHLEMVRPGIALYGSNPLINYTRKLIESVVLKGNIIQVRQIDLPQTVGYGASHRATGPTRIATVSVGYADGYPRGLSNAGFAIVDGVRVPVVGRVSMDLITLDVSALSLARCAVGTQATLLGEGVDIDDLADAAGTISYEILTHLGQRYHRVYKGAVDPRPRGPSAG
ncbi:MAG: alanine racemase [Alphaproteobacteria bacterium]|nr:alanine racemase [Alphaproteobacteria bacterium]